jgi:anionic cell wall polymer biosynthesis LytR-Cps2A-Psr (LCP) family protein
MKKGEDYTLMGRDALAYIRGRSDPQLSDNSNLARMRRQTQYYKAFFDTAKDTLKDDPLYALELYNEMDKSVVTDLSVDEITYLVKLVMNMELDDERIMTIPGEADPVTDDFIADDDALKEMLLSVFFEEVQ